MAYLFKRHSGRYGKWQRNEELGHLPGITLYCGGNILLKVARDDAEFRLWDFQMKKDGFSVDSL